MSHNISCCLIEVAIKTVWSLDVGKLVSEWLVFNARWAMFPAMQWRERKMSYNTRKERKMSYNTRYCLIEVVTTAVCSLSLWYWSLDVNKRVREWLLFNAKWAYIMERKTDFSMRWLCPFLYQINTYSMKQWYSNQNRSKLAYS